MELNKCLDAIKEHAFAASPYPVILTLEDHLTPDLQAKVAKVPAVSSLSTLNCVALQTPTITHGLCDRCYACRC